MNATAKFYTGFVISLVLIVALSFGVGYRMGHDARSTRAVPACLIQSAEKTSRGSLNTSGRCRREKCDRLPVPSMQIMPAPMPPSGKATRLSVGPA